MKQWTQMLVQAVRLRLHPNWYAKVNENARCPACGHRNGKIKVVKTGGQDRAAIEHSCLVCAAIFYEPTIMKPEKWLAQ